MAPSARRPTWRLRIRRWALALLRPLDAVAQRIVPSNPRRVCYASEPDYADSAFAVYRHLLETRDGLEHVWLLNDLSAGGRLREDFERMARPGHRLVIRPWRLRSYPAFLRSRYSFHTHGLYSFARPSNGRVSVSLWHGMPVKAIRRLHKGNTVLFPVRGTYQVATSSFFRYVVASAFDVDPHDVLVSGLPRTDVLKGFTAPRHDREAIADRLGLDPDRPWLLWMPTHRSEPDFRGSRPARSFIDATDPALMRALGDACRDSGVQVIVKLHIFDLLNVDAGAIDLPFETMSLVTAPDWQALGIQLYDLVAASDGLITDVSSVFMDYLHTGRPIGVLGFDAGAYTRETLFDPELLIRCAAATRLDGPADVQRFVSGVADDRPVAVGRDDMSTVFNEDQEIASTEAVVKAAGL